MPVDSKVGRRIKRTRELSGVSVPAVIHNGSYFFINLKVYEDGVVDCWDMVDLNLLSEKLDSGWLVPFVPDGQEISIHGLGSWTVEGGKWNFNPLTFLTQIESVVAELNPKQQNLYNFHGSNTKKIGKVNSSVLSMGSPKPFRQAGPFDRGVTGESLSVFLATSKKKVYLADLRVFEDGTIELGRIPKVETVTFDELKEMAKRKRLMTQPEKGTGIDIFGLGSFTLGEEGYATNLDDLLLEIQDCILKLRGEPDSTALCLAAHHDYCANPTQEGVDRLRATYEAVPEQNRMYLGDMDTKDIPIRMIIYGDAEIESWSHRLVARNQGMELPEISVPRPADPTEEE